MQAGRAAVFCRFAGCNLWSGLERDRATAVCRFCDTDFVGVGGTSGGRFGSAEELAGAIERSWSGGPDHRLAVLTGGEPLLQVDSALIDALHARSFAVAVETNGTRPAPARRGWGGGRRRGGGRRAPAGGSAGGCGRRGRRRP